MSGYNDINVKMNQNKKKIINKNNAKQIGKLEIDKQENISLFTERQFKLKSKFYVNALSVISVFFDICSDYMLFDEKSKIEWNLSSAILSCYSDSGNILIDDYKHDLLNQFISTMTHVLMAPKLYKKPYLTLTKKLLSSSFGIGIILSNHKLINNSQNGLKYIESVINPRSISVYNKDKGNDPSYHKQKQTQKQMFPINKKRKFSEISDNDDLSDDDNHIDDVDDDDADDIDDIDINDNVEPLWSY